jgi:hydrogenase/urease accessory protein HupE
VGAAAVLAGCLALVAVEAASAHAFAPALLELREGASGTIDVRWKQPATRAMGSSLRPVLPGSCSGVGEAELLEEGTGVVANWAIECPGGLVGKTVGVEGLAASGADALLRVAFAEGRSVRHVLTATSPAFQIPERESRAAVLQTYGALGFTHIVTGYDHLLFVLGLVILIGTGRPLLWTVTAFTIGHSLTLGLAALGLVRLPQQPIEAAIAFSIYVLALEIARRSNARRSLLQSWPWLMAGGFGLLHGLGFAGALSAIGLPQGEIPLALFAFNVGIELGQLAFVGVILASWAMLRRIPIQLPEAARLVPAYGIGSLAAFWCIERTWLATAAWRAGGGP